MSRRISQSITPTNSDIEILREPFVNKGANDPVVLEVKRLINDATPDWLRKLTGTVELTSNQLADIRTAADENRKLVELVLPADSPVRIERINKLDAVLEVIEEMTTEMAGTNAFSGISA